jgi:RNA polymerase sigma-70 factor (ECF subfamily)
VSQKGAGCGGPDLELAGRLRAGDEKAFRELVREYGGRLSRLARTFSHNDAVIEEAVQETWLAVIRGIAGFEGRAPLRSWMFGILVNQARRLAVRERRHAQLTAGASRGQREAPADSEEREPGMGANGMWETPPVPWGLEDPESAMLSKEVMAVVEAALDELPESQRQVMLLRDVEGLSPVEVCNFLEVSDTNVRVLLHRGRARVRRALDEYMREGGPGEPPVARGRA